MCTFLFILFTWGVIVALPVACFFASRSLWPSAQILVHIGVALAVFLFGVLSGEWLARFVNATLDRFFTRRDAKSHDNAA
jgi:glycerol uptake facilitator-like aquaporin